MKYTFPENFWWGAATSGPQSEGRFNKKHDNVFDHWFDINPELFHNGIGPNIASNFYNSYKEDLAMLKEIEHNPDCHEFISQEELMKELNIEI